MTVKRRIRTRIGAGLVGLILVGIGLIWSGQTPGWAQRIRLEQVSQQIYQQLPNLPLENQYISAETGDVSEANTLLNRLIRYHVYVKGRPINYRLDWKLTLADYLGVNERMEAETYPSATGLRVNPLEGDIAAVRSLTLAQRTALVDALAASFTPASSSTAPSPSPTPTVTPPAPAPSPPSRFPPQTQPGDAQLLRP
ncbi:MAG: hypothetical protein ACKO7W_20380 [Elainella sp.]